MNEHDADTPYKRSDTEEVRSSNLLTPTMKLQVIALCGGLFSWGAAKRPPRGRQRAAKFFNCFVKFSDLGRIGER